MIKCDYNEGGMVAVVILMACGLESLKDHTQEVMIEGNNGSPDLFQGSRRYD